MNNIPKWTAIRKTIIKRDNGCCRICGREHDLHVHHIDYNRLNNADTNLVTLCQSCHQAVHKENYKPYDDYPAPWDKTSPKEEYNQEISW